MKKSLKGFTLVEMLIVIVAVGIIGSMTARLLIQGSDIFVSETNRQSFMSEVRFAFWRIMRESHGQVSKEQFFSSTSKDIKMEINNGNFREDLFHRLNVFQIDIEPLSSRVSDIPLLIEYFSKKIIENYNLKKFNIDSNNHYLINYSWPGNVRELRNLIERIGILSPNNEEKVSNIIKESLKTSEEDNFKVENSLSIPLKEARENFEKKYLTTQLKKFGGNISKTAKFVGMERSALHRKLKQLGVKDLN